MKTIWMIIAALAMCACESTTQTAIRSNEVPAIAYVVAANKGEPLPTAIIIRENE